MEPRLVTVHCQVISLWRLGAPRIALSRSYAAKKEDWKFGQTGKLKQCWDNRKVRGWVGQRMSSFLVTYRKTMSGTNSVNIFSDKPPSSVWPGPESLLKGLSLIVKKKKKSPRLSYLSLHCFPSQPSSYLHFCCQA